MLYPSIDKLLNIIDSKYKLINVVAKRDKMMREYGNYQMSENEYKSVKPIGRSLEEIEKGLVSIKQ